MLSIKKSVGPKQANALSDVQVVRTLLNRVIEAKLLPTIKPLAGTGPADEALFAAIEAFQRHVSKANKPDGKVEPGKRTFQWLAKFANPNVNGGPFFPLAKLPSATNHWTGAARFFGALSPTRKSKEGGPRAHAGCDLICARYDSVYAVTKGTVIQKPYPYYDDTYALEVNHHDFVIMYGEIEPGSCGFLRGDEVQAGERIAEVGSTKMLHLEMYTGCLTGRLSTQGTKLSLYWNKKTKTSTSFNKQKAGDLVTFERRKDLINPEPHLQVWKKTLPKEY